MELSIWSFIIVCPCVFLAGFVDAIGGGGGLISLPAYLFAGVPAHLAVGTNKLSSAVGTVFSTARYCKHGDVEYALAIPGVIASLCGSLMGARIALYVSDEFFRKFLFITLPFIGIYVLLRKDLEPKDSEKLSGKKLYIIVTIVSFLVGTYDGFYGPGTGTFLLLAYTGLAKMNVLKAAGNVKLANLASNCAALAVFLINGVVVIPLGLAAAIFSIAGHYTGAGLAIKNGSKFVRAIILIVIGILFIKMISELFF